MLGPVFDKKTDQGSITSPCKHPVWAAHAVRSHKRSPCFIKRSIHRLAHTDLIRTVTEDRDTQQQKYKCDKAREKKLGAWHW